MLGAALNETNLGAAVVSLAVFRNESTCEDEIRLFKMCGDVLSYFFCET